HDFDTFLVDEVAHPLRGEIARDSQGAGKVENADTAVRLQRSNQSGIEVAEVPLSVSVLRGRHGEGLSLFYCVGSEQFRNHDSVDSISQKFGQYAHYLVNVRELRKILVRSAAIRD